jgi:hypothetical protein
VRVRAGNLSGVVLHETALERLGLRLADHSDTV